MFSVCTSKVGLNLAGLFSLKGSVDVKGFDRTGTCTSLLLLSSASGPACDVVGEGWGVAGYLVFTCLVPGTTKNRLGLSTPHTKCMK